MHSVTFESTKYREHKIQRSIIYYNEIGCSFCEVPQYIHHSVMTIFMEHLLSAHAITLSHMTLT